MVCGASRFASRQATLEGRNEMPGSRIARRLRTVLCLLLEKLTVVQLVNESPPLGNSKLHYCVLKAVS